MDEAVDVRVPMAELVMDGMHIGMLRSRYYVEKGLGAVAYMLMQMDHLMAFYIMGIVGVTCQLRV